MKVIVKDGNVTQALRKLKKKVDESKLLLDVVNRQQYEKPTTKKKRKAKAAEARWKKKLRDQELPPKLY